MKPRSPRLARWLVVGAVGGVLGVAVASLKAEHAVIALSPGIALLSLWWMYHLTPVFSIKRLTVPAAFYWMYFLRVYLPAHVIFLENRGPAGWRYILAVLAVLVLVPLGIALAQVILHRGVRHTRRFFASAAWSAVPLKTKLVWFLGLLALSVVVIALHLTRLPTIPVIQLVRNPGQAAAFTALRESSLKTLAVSSWLRYLMAWTRDLFLPLLTLLCWSEYRVSKKKKWVARGLVVLGLGLFYTSLTLAKEPIAQLLLALVLFYWLWSDVKLSPQRILAAAGLVLLFPFIVTFLKYGSRFAPSDIFAIISGLWHRLFYITADMPYHYFNLFPVRGEFLGGRTIGLLSSLMGWKYFNTSRYVYDVIVPDGLEVGYANSAFIGDLYADFGMWGVLLGSFLAGFILQTLQVYLERQPKTTLLMAVYPVVCVAVTNLVSTSITITLMTGGVLMAVAVLWCARYLGPLLLPTQRSSSGRLLAAGNLAGGLDMDGGRGQ